MFIDREVLAEVRVEVPSEVVREVRVCDIGASCSTAAFHALV